MTPGDSGQGTKEHDDNRYFGYCFAWGRFRQETSSQEYLDGSGHALDGCPDCSDAAVGSEFAWEPWECHGCNCGNNDIGHHASDSSCGAPWSHPPAIERGPLSQHKRSQPANVQRSSSSPSRNCNSMERKCKQDKVSQGPSVNPGV